MHINTYTYTCMHLYVCAFKICEFVKTFWMGSACLNVFNSINRLINYCALFLEINIK